MVGEEEKKSKDQEMTPEEKLFRVISSGGREEPDGLDELEMGPDFYKKLKPVKGFFKKIAKIVQKGFLITRDFLAQYFKEIKIRDKVKPFRLQKEISTKHFNVFFVFLIVILAIYFIVSLTSRSWRQTGGDESSGFGLSKVVQFPSQDFLKPISYYLMPVQERNVFLSPQQQQQQAANESPDAKGSSTEAAMQGFKLVGISWDAEEYVAMIEPPSQNAQFVRKGDTLSNGVKVKEIKEYAVVLQKGRDKWDLT